MACVFGLAVAALFSKPMATALTTDVTALWRQKMECIAEDLWGVVYGWERLKPLEASLQHNREEAALPETTQAVGNATVDSFGGYMPGLALLNGLNYRPRPVFQSYAAFTPRLARLNHDFYASARAPDYTLVKIQSIDDRLPAFDDSLLLNLLLYRYDYMMAEKGFQLWHRRADAPDPALVAPRRLRTIALPINTPLELEELSKEHVWVEIDLPFSLLGRLRNFLYKAPFVHLVIKDTDGRESYYRLPLLQARTGFILTPLIENITDYMNFAGGHPKRLVRRFTVEVAAADRKYFAPSARVGLFSLTPSEAGARYLSQVEQARFWMFKTAPISSNAFVATSETEIDGRRAIVMHAPSEMEFLVPADARTISGAFGYVPGAYQGDGHTDGAEFRVVWVDGTDQAVLFSRYLDPRNQPTDRGLQSFQASLQGHTRGRLRLEIDPGPRHDTGWDWTAWTEIEIK